MPIKKICLIQISFDFCEDDRTQIFLFDNLRGKAFNS